MAAAALAALAVVAPSRVRAEANARGKELFQLCAQCHGPEGAGNQLALAPAIAGLPEWYINAQLHNLKSGARGTHPEDTGGLRFFEIEDWAVATSLKDVRLMLEQGQRFGVPMFLTGIYAQIAQIGSQIGYAESDPASIVEVLRGMAGLPRRK